MGRGELRSSLFFCSTPLIIDPPPESLLWFNVVPEIKFLYLTTGLPVESLLPVQEVILHHLLTCKLGLAW